jgi:CRP-like cAMP-binding protein
MASSPEDIQQQIVDHLKTIPIFERLTTSEIQRIYSLCAFNRYRPDDLIYKFGDPSGSLFVLLDGQVVARTKTGVDIAYISPVGVVGEMGVLTDEPRSADVVAFDDVMGFEISKEGLVDLFLEDGSICRKILLNVIKILSAKLYDTNAEIEKLREEASKPVTTQNEADNIFLY